MRPDGQSSLDDESQNPSPLEKYNQACFESIVALKLDQHGLPLVPQPSEFKDDPLNWPAWLKWAVLIQVGFMAFVGPFDSGLINPNLVHLSEAMHENTKVVAYSTTTAIILGGVSSFIWTPLANIYGRRPITLIAILMTIIGSIGSAVSPSFGALVGMRAITGFGFGGMMSVGTAVVNDVFFLHERGEKTGVYVVFVTNGAHVAALAGGFLGQGANWQWDYWLGAAVTGVSFIVALFLFPETLFSRDPEFLAARSYERSYSQMLFNIPGNRIPGRRLHAGDFLNSFYMLKYPSVSFTFWYYSWSWAFINVLPAITLAAIYSSEYKFKSGPIGACLGIPLIVGSVLGEMCSGRLSDYIMLRMAKRNNGVRKPEFRLYLSTISAFFMPLGIIIFGACAGNTGFLPPLVGLSLGAFGLQVASTCLYAYISDCYKPQTPETGVIFNLARGLSFVVGFFALPYAEKVGYFWAWFTFAVVLFGFFFPVGALIFYGERWRNTLGSPKFHRFM